MPLPNELPRSAGANTGDSNAKGTSLRGIFLVNQGVDQAVRGLERLKKAAAIGEEIYGNTLATLEHAGAQVNLQFLADMEQAEKRDAARYERRASNERGPASALHARDSPDARRTHPKRAPTKGTLARGVRPAFAACTGLRWDCWNALRRSRA